MKKVLYVMSMLKNGDGVSTSIMNYYNVLISAGWTADFMVLQDTPCEWKTKVMSDGGKIFVLPNESKYFPSFNQAIEKVIRDNEYNIIHMNEPGHIAVQTFKAAKRAGIKTRIFHCHNPKNAINLKTKVSGMLYDPLCISLSTHLMACSQSAGKSRFGKRPFYALKNVVDTESMVYSIEKRVELRKNLNIDNCIVVGVVGRFASQKNPYFLVEIFCKLKEIDPRYYLLWLGEGGLRENIESLLVSKRLSDDYYFPGLCHNVNEWYSAMDLFLLPSRFEGLGIAFFEAQCTGLNCFGSTNVPLETKVTELMHRISLEKSAVEWATAINECMKRNVSRRNRSEDFIDAGYTHDSTCSDLLAYYLSIVNEEEK